MSADDGGLTFVTGYLSEAIGDERATIARLVEIVIGIGIPDRPGCDLCGRDTHPCPVHLGEAAADLIVLWLSHRDAARAQKAHR